MPVLFPFNLHIVLDPANAVPAYPTWSRRAPTYWSIAFTEQPMQQWAEQLNRALPYSSDHASRCPPDLITH